MSTAPIILIADRNDDALKYLKEELEPTEYALLHAKDGHEVLSLVETQAHQIAFALVELELPGVNGLHLIGRLTGQEPRPKKIIATTFLEDELLSTERAIRTIRNRLHNDTLPARSSNCIPGAINRAKNDGCVVLRTLEELPESVLSKVTIVGSTAFWP
jgi:CheY-like chemotaxis protein